MTSTLTSKPTLNPVLRSFWTTQARNKVLYGGRSSSKSWDAAGIAIFLSNKYSLRFCCARQIQNKIEESVYTLLKIQIDRFGLRHRFRILNNKIINRVTGSEFVFYGLWRNIEEIKSLEGISVLWLEEAHALTEYQWKILEPTIRKKDFFANLKAQAWWLVADRFRNTFNAVKNGEQYPVDELISIDSSCPLLEKLKLELTTPHRDFDKNGRVMVESKKDLAKRDVPSPNVADAFIMAFAPTDTAMDIWEALGNS
ncbi:TPA: phage terminase large subunit [Klebsiella pneumoniae]|nr:phage terminase large subunit [Klebsiella pneumoniae]HEE3952306.1 phage terminase large subunit [Klebsiella pneumoniae]